MGFLSCHGHSRSMPIVSTAPCRGAARAGQLGSLRPLSAGLQSAQNLGALSACGKAPNLAYGCFACACRQARLLRLACRPSLGAHSSQVCPLAVGGIPADCNCRSGPVEVADGAWSAGGYVAAGSGPAARAHARFAELASRAICSWGIDVVQVPHAISCHVGLWGPGYMSEAAATSLGL